jgi:hypothetical protein
MGSFVENGAGTGWTVATIILESVVIENLDLLSYYSNIVFGNPARCKEKLRPVNCERDTSNNESFFFTAPSDYSGTKKESKRCAAAQLRSRKWV